MPWNGTLSPRTPTRTQLRLRHRDRCSAPSSNPARRKGDACAGRSPGSRVVASRPAFPASWPVASVGRQLAAHSCGCSHGFRRRPPAAGLTVFPFRSPKGNRHGRDSSLATGRVTRRLSVRSGCQARIVLLPRPFVATRQSRRPCAGSPGKGRSPNPAGRPCCKANGARQPIPSGSSLQATP